MMIALPLPPRILSPNGRSHWAAKAKAVKAARRKAWLTTLAAPKGSGPWTHYEVRYYWPTKRRMDDDNALSCCKAYLDGYCDAMGFDDLSLTLGGLKHFQDKANPRVEIYVWGNVQGEPLPCSASYDPAHNL